jgi:hypothetical protein
MAILFFDPRERIIDKEKKQGKKVSKPVCAQSTLAIK